MKQDWDAIVGLWKAAEDHLGKHVLIAIAVCVALAVLVHPVVGVLGILGFAIYNSGIVQKLLEKLK